VPVWALTSKRAHPAATLPLGSIGHGIASSGQPPSFMGHEHETGPWEMEEHHMNMIYRTFRWFAAIAFVCTAGILPSCASMGGGGGMKYVASDPIPMEQSRAM